MYNHITILGRIVRNIELKRTQSGKAVCTLCVAVERSMKDKDGNKVTDFMDVTLWDKKAEAVSKYLSKGRMTLFSGSMESRNYTDKDGNKRKTWELKAQDFSFADSATKQDPSPQQAFEEIPEDEEDGDMPF